MADQFNFGDHQISESGYVQYASSFHPTIVDISRIINENARKGANADLEAELEKLAAEHKYTLMAIMQNCMRSILNVTLILPRPLNV